MSADFASTLLSHHFLIAMPGLEDPTFAKSVVYLCEHSERGAMGLIINKPGELSLKHLFDKVELPLHREDLLQSNVLHLYLECPRWLGHDHLQRCPRSHVQWFWS